MNTEVFVTTLTALSVLLIVAGYLGGVLYTRLHEVEKLVGGLKVGLEQEHLEVEERVSELEKGLKSLDSDLAGISLKVKETSAPRRRGRPPKILGGSASPSPSPSPKRKKKVEVEVEVEVEAADEPAKS